MSLLSVQPFMWQQSTRFHKIQSLGCSTASLPNASRESENHSFVPSRDPSQRLPATTRRLRQNPTRPLKQKAALATSPLRANSTGCRVDNRIAASLPQPRAIHRSQERPPRLHSRGNCSRTPHAVAAARARAPQPIELARAPCGCKAAQIRSTKPHKTTRCPRARANDNKS